MLEPTGLMRARQTLTQAQGLLIPLRGFLRAQERFYSEILPMERTDPASVSILRDTFSWPPASSREALRSEDSVVANLPHRQNLFHPRFEILFAF